jgi:hypothetical protein
MKISKAAQLEPPNDLHEDTAEGSQQQQQQQHDHSSSLLLHLSSTL